MTNPDRTELGSQSKSAPETPKKNGHIPRWLRVPAFAVRTSLAILAAGPGMVVAADLITRAENPYTVYADTQTTPTPSEKGIETRIAEAQATGTALAKDKELAGLQVTQTAVSEEIDALKGTPTKTPVPSKTPVPTTTGTSTPTSTITPTWTQEQIEGKKRAGLLTDTPTPKPTLTPEPGLTQVASTGSSTTTPEIPGWLWGLGITSLAGLAAYWGYERGKRKNPLPPPPSPYTTPSTGPAQPKNPEWVIGQREFERRWQAVKSKLSPVLPGDQGDESGYILDRFKTGMNVVHEVSLDDATNVPEMDTRVRAGIEYLIPEIWPNSEIPKNFFDPDFFPPEDLAKTIYIPEQYRNLSSFTKGQKRDVMRIRRILLHALHPDLLRIEADPKLQDRIDTLLIQLNSAWPLINKLLS